MSHPRGRRLAAVIVVAATALTGQIVCGSAASAAALAPPVVGEFASVDDAFAELVADAQIDIDTMCLELSQMPEATHVVKGTPSDETLACEIPATAEQGREVQALVHSVRLSHSRVTNTALAITGSLAAYTFVMQWAAQLVHCGDVWLSGELGPLVVEGWQPSPTFAEDIASMWAYCTRRPATDPEDPGTTPGTDPGTTPGEGTGTTPTYLEVVMDRFAADAEIVRDRQPTPNQVKRAARDCVKSEKAARAAGVIGRDEHPCRDEPIFMPGADAGWAAVHDATAIASNPAWAELTYGRAPGVLSGWYRAGGFKLYAAGKCFAAPGPRGVQCDEYPFISTNEGGPGASLAEVPASQNSREGSRLSSMYTDAACGMIPNQTTFFVVPTAVPLAGADGTIPGFGAATATFSGLPTMHVCTSTPAAMPS